jgi:hypothetical protein
VRKALLSVFVLLIASGCIAQPQNTGMDQIPVTLTLNYSGHSQTFEATVPGNSSVLDLLSRYATLDYTDYLGAGAFINSINNVSNSEDSYWMFYVNGTLADVGVSAYLINQSIAVEMRYEKPSW